MMNRTMSRREKDQTKPELHADDLTEERRENNSATYCLADDKLRLYVGRVEYATFLYLRDKGFVSTPKQDCDFVAPWTLGREDIALALIPDADDVGDEAMSPTERAADRAERFEQYRQNRLRDAGAFADRFDTLPAVVGMQDGRKAQKLASRRDGMSRHALSHWSRAEYWTERTAGVIANALYRESASVRRGRIKDLEKEVRDHAESCRLADVRWRAWQAIKAHENAEEATKAARQLSGDGRWGGSEYQHPRNAEQKPASLYSLMTDPVDPISGHEAADLALSRYTEHGPNQAGTWRDRLTQHLANRMTYEKAMLAEEGGFAGEEEMIAGGFWDGDQIHKVNKSVKSRRVTTVEVRRFGAFYNRATRSHEQRYGLVRVSVERAGQGHYRAPTPEELAEFNAAKKEVKDAKTPISTINPTVEDAQRFQAYLNRLARAEVNEYYRRQNEVTVTTQKAYSYYSKGDSYRIAQYTVGDVTFKLRVHTPLIGANGVIILSDKPKKAIPIDWNLIESPASTPAAEEAAV